MKIQIASDLHLEMRRGRLPAPGEFRAAPDRDILVLAGDIGTHTCAWDFVQAAARTFPSRLRARQPRVLQPPDPGAHKQRMEAQSTDEHAGLHYLLAEGVVIGGVRFWGAPWYSDFLRTAGFGTYQEGSRAGERFRSAIRRLRPVVGGPTS